MTLENNEHRFLLIYASQTGQAKAIAEEIAERAPEYGLSADIHCASLTEKRFWLEREKLAVIVTSTTGEGEAPETAAKFWRRLKKRTLASNHLENLQYTLLGLGDTNYANFCNNGKAWDKRLAELGAQRFYPSDWADDAVGLEIVVDPWIDGLFPALRQHFGLPAEEEITANPLIFGNPKQPVSDTNTIANEDKLPSNTKSNDIVNGKAESNSIDVVSSQESESSHILDTSHEKINGSGKIESNQSHVHISTSSDYYPEQNSIPASNEVPVDISNSLKSNSSNESSSTKVTGDTIEQEVTEGKAKPILNSAKEVIEDKLAEKLTQALVINEVKEDDGESLTRSLPPLCDGSLACPVCPAPYLQLHFIDDDLNTDDLNIQNNCAFPSAKSEIQHVPIVKAVRMTTNDAVKTALNISLDISSCGWSYEPGDAIGIVCPNNDVEVQWLIERLNLEDKAKNAAKLEVKAGTKKKSAKVPEYISPVFTIKHALTTCCDIRCVPKKAFIRALVEYTTDDKEKRRLQELCSKQGADHYTKYIREPSLGIIDILAAFPSCMPPIELLFEHLPRLNARPYSASSCQLVDSGIFEFVFNIVDIPGGNGRVFHKQGLCTGWLDSITKCIQRSVLNDQSAEAVINQGAVINQENIPTVPVFVRTNQYFRAPEDLSTPYIMIGPGTGVAPFVGFLQQREFLIKQRTVTSEIGNTWLFYGCRHRNKDFLFRDELKRFNEAGVLTHLCVSFSRDEQTADQPKYVQDSLRLHAPRVLDMLLSNEKSKVYVCGDALGMSKDVYQTFIDLLQKHKGMSCKDAEAFMFQLRFHKRYTEDVWT